MANHYITHIKCFKKKNESFTYFITYIQTCYIRLNFCLYINCTLKHAVLEMKFELTGLNQIL